MLTQRLAVVILLLPVGVALIFAGGWILTIVAAALLGIAAWEYWRMFKNGGYNPSAPVLIGGVVGLVLLRQVFELSGSEIFLGMAVLLAMTTHIISYEKGQETSAIDFNITLGGILYLGWLGSYFVSLRNLPDGLWWLLLVLPASWMADGAAFFVGRKFGKHKFSPRVSPKKTVEGYLGGIIAAGLGTMLLAIIWQQQAPAITPLRGFIIGLTISILTPIGDLGESMLKREFGVKDTSHILPGHGGIMDRIDSWLWAVMIGYYLIVWAWK